MGSLAESLINHPAVTGINMNSNTAMRRVSVENLLAAPLDHNGFYNNEYGLQSFKQEDQAQYDTNDQGLEDDDIEEIQRNGLDFDANFSMQQVNNAREFFRMNATYRDQMSIPRRLDPLPQWLLDSDQNRMYFHHYLKHTARLLVPHDCSENPFKHILPQSRLPIRYFKSCIIANHYQWPSRPII